MERTEIDVREVLSIMRRQRRLILTTVVAILGLAFAYLLSATPIYRATTLVQIDAQGTNLLDPNATDQQQSAIVNSQLDSEVEILRSSSAALAVVKAGDLIHAKDFGPQIGRIEKLGIAMGIDLSDDALRQRVGLGAKMPTSPEDLINATILKLQGAVDVRRQGLTYLIGISVSSPNPSRAAELANLYAKTYIDSQVSAKIASLLSARDVLRRQISTAQEQLATSEAAVNSFIEANLARLEKESGDPAVAALRNQLESAKADQGALGARIASAQGAIGAQDWDSVAQSLGDAALAELARQRKDLQQRLGKAATGTSDAVDLATQLDSLDKNLATRSQTTLAVVQKEATTLSTRETSARDALRTTLVQSNLSPEMVTELFNLQQSATVARTQYQTLLSREQDIGTLANLQVANARIVSAALTPNAPSAPRTNLILTFGLVGGIAVAVMLSFLKEYYIGGITSASQLQNVLQVRVPISVPQVDQPDSGSPADMVILAPMSLFAETFRKLRASIDIGLERIIPNHKGASVILVCSALPAEGKSTSAIALARTYALAGARTMLIDADLRKPSLELVLSCKSTVGLLEYLVGAGKTEAQSAEAVHDFLSPLLVLTAGERSSVPTDQLINSKAFNQLLKQLAPDFDVIVIDSPPILPVVDAGYLARYADIIVQVVRYGSTTQGEVREANSQMQEMMRPGTQILGVLSQEERSNRSYRYYVRHGSYYGKDAG